MDPTTVNAAILGGLQLIRMVSDSIERRQRGELSDEEFVARLQALQTKVGDTDRRLDDLIAELEAEQA